MRGDQPLTFGDVQIYWLKGGKFRLDGGTMFGPVPKVLGAQCCPVDAENTILMGNDPLLVKTQDSIVMVDTGLGNKLTAKQNSIFKVSNPHPRANSVYPAEDFSWFTFYHDPFVRACRLDCVHKIKETWPNPPPQVVADVW